MSSLPRPTVKGQAPEERRPCRLLPAPTPGTAKNQNGLKLIAREECWAENIPKQETTKGTQSL